MKIGIKTKYESLEQIPQTFKSYNIQHVQFSLPANFRVNKEYIYKIVYDFKNTNPNIELSIHSYPYNLAETVEVVRDLWVELAKETINFANKIEARFVNFHGGYANVSGKRNEHEEVINDLIPTLYRLTEEGLKNDVEIHIENLYQENRNSDFSKMCDRLSDFENIFKSIDAPTLKLCYDYGHGNLDEHGIDILHKYYSRLGSIHAHDNDQLSDIHWPIGNNELGTIEWKNEIQFLNDIEFKGAFIIESYENYQLESLEYLERIGI